MNRATARFGQISGAIAMGATLIACGGTADSLEAEETQTTHAIVNGTPATSFPEAALVDAFSGSIQVSCSGTVVSPHVVVTAAMCLHRFGPWRVTVPYAGGQSVLASSGAVFDWTPTNPNRHNIGVIFLPTPITLASYPKFATAPVADGSSVLRLGRSLNGAASNTELFVSAPVAVKNGVADGFPFEYVAPGTLEFGDQGGGVQLPNHELIAINTNAKDGIVALTRVDLVATWLREQIVLAGDATSGSQWVDMNTSPHACHNQPGMPCGWSATDNGHGYTCGLRHPSWAEPWTCEPGQADPNWVSMLDDAGACLNQPGKGCGWSATNNGEGYTCALRHPEWANGWTCEP